MGGGNPRRRAVRIAAALLAAALVAGCDESPAPPPDAVAVPQERELADGSIVLIVPRTTHSDQFPALARARCADRSPCTVRAWVSPGDAPTTLPLTDTQVMTQAYGYISNRVTKFELSQWNCLMYQRVDQSQCMPDLAD